MAQAGVYLLQREQGREIQLALDTRESCNGQV